MDARPIRTWATIGATSVLLLAGCGLKPDIDARLSATPAVQAQEPTGPETRRANDAAPAPIAAPATRTTAPSGGTAAPGAGNQGSVGGPDQDPVGTTDGPTRTATSANEATHEDSGSEASAGKVAIGIQYSEDLQSGFAAVGAEGEAPSERRIAQALVDWVNANGGLAGREVVPVFHGTDSTSGTWASQAQAACATFTEDNDVFAVVSSVVGGDDSLLACLAPSGTPLIELNGWPFDEPYFEQHRGGLYQPGRMRPERWVRAYVDGLVDIGFFEGATVGLVRFDDPVFGRLADRLLKPRLEHHAVTLEEEAVISSPTGVGDFGNVSAQISSAILRFRRAGVDHVLMLENASILPFLFMPQAESQGYRPMYGVTSSDQPDTMQRQGPERQLENTVGIGWSPSLDVYDEVHPGGNSSYDLCREIMRTAGIEELRGYYIQPRCGSFFFLRAALEAAPGLTRDGLLAGVEGLGDSFLAPSTMGSSFGPGKYSGADVVRPLAYSLDCSCFRYTHEPRRVG